MQFRPKRIALVGYDMHIAHGVHWHGKHQGLNNPTTENVKRWRRVVDAAAEQIEAMGVDVVNCSTVSALKNYRIGTLEEALGC